MIGPIMATRWQQTHQTFIELLCCILLLIDTCLVFLDSLWMCVLISLYKVLSLFCFALFWCGIYGLSICDSDHDVKTLWLFQYTLCCIFVLCHDSKTAVLKKKKKVNPLDNFPPCSWSNCSAADTVFHTCYCHVWRKHMSHSVTWWSYVVIIWWN